MPVKGYARNILLSKFQIFFKNRKEIDIWSGALGIKKKNGHEWPRDVY